MVDVLHMPSKSVRLKIFPLGWYDCTEKAVGGLQIVALPPSPLLPLPSLPPSSSLPHSCHYRYRSYNWDLEGDPVQACGKQRVPKLQQVTEKCRCAYVQHMFLVASRIHAEARPRHGTRAHPIGWRLWVGEPAANEHSSPINLSVPLQVRICSEAEHNGRNNERQKRPQNKKTQTDPVGGPLDWKSTETQDTKSQP